MTDLRLVFVLLVGMFAFGAADYEDMWRLEEETPLVLEYEQLVKNIDKVTSDEEFQALRDASSYWKNKGRGRTINTAEALGRGLVEVYTYHRPEGFLQTTRFNKLYNEYITEPCKVVKKLMEELNAFVDKHPELDDWKFRIYYIPNRAYNLVRMCADRDVNTINEVYAWFKHLRNPKKD